MKTLMFILLMGFVLWCDYAEAGLCSWICRSVCPIPGVCHVACKLLCTDPVSVKTYIFPLPNPE
ncbi:hypothetical protein X975_15301, partial [Stegodyphus mimosarum]